MAVIRHVSVDDTSYDFVAGDEVLLVTLTNNVADKTYAEISAAINDGKEVIVKESYRYYYLTSTSPITFTRVIRHYSDRILVDEWTVVSTNVWTNYNIVAVAVPTPANIQGEYKLVATVGEFGAVSYAWDSTPAYSYTDDGDGNITISAN